MNKNLYVDVPSIVQVLGSIFTHPEILENGQYNFIPEDFPQDFHKIIFESIYNLNKLGVKKVTVETIEDYLNTNPKKYGIYQANQGSKYLEKITLAAQPDAFDFYYNRLKKFTLLRAYSDLGMDLSDFYDPNSLDLKVLSLQEERLNNTSLENIANYIEIKIDEIKIKYAQESQDLFVEDNGDKIRRLIAGYKENPALGAPLYDEFSNTIFRGARRKKLYLRSAPSGVGKSRAMIADACNLGYDEFYDVEKGEWVSLGKAIPTLYINSEMDDEEILTIRLAFLSGVPEDKIVMGTFSPQEEERIYHAVKIIERGKLKINIVSNYDLTQIENIIKTSNRKYKINYIFFDYLHSTQKILSQVSLSTGIKGLQEYSILFLIANRLKELCNELNCFILTSTQLNGDWKTAKIFDQNLLRGSKSIADKIDAGMILMDVVPEDLEKLTPITSQLGVIPNAKMSVYKNRGNKYNKMLVWYKMDKGIARLTPLFCTTYDFELIEGVEKTKIKVE